MKMGFDIVQFLMGPANILTQGLVGRIMGLGMNALQIWLMYEIVVIVPARSKNLIDAIDVELLSKMDEAHEVTHWCHNSSVM